MQQLDIVLSLIDGLSAGSAPLMDWAPPECNAVNGRMGNGKDARGKIDECAAMLHVPGRVRKVMNEGECKTR